MVDISERSSILRVGGRKSECVEGSGRKEEGYIQLLMELRENI